MSTPPDPAGTDWTAIVHEHGAAVWRLARRILGDEADAGDCFQETFVAALSASRAAPVANWPGLLRRLCTARAIDLLPPPDPRPPPHHCRRGGGRTCTAAVMIAIVLPSGSGSGLAFATMLDKVREMKSVRYRTTVPGVEQTARAEKAPFLVTIETAVGVRLETGPLVTVFRRDGGLLLDTTSKSATTFSNDEAKDRRRERPDLLGQFRQADGSWGEPIKGKQVGTVAARGYRVTKKWIGAHDPKWVSMLVYVDPATELPVRVEQEVRLSDDEKSEPFVKVMSDFEWDIEVDPALLSLDPPAGYRHERSDEEATAVISPPEAIAAGLRFYADHLKGDLPNGIEGFEPTFALQGAVFDDAARKEFLALDMGAKMKFVRQRLAPWFCLRQALDDLEKKNIKVHYLGKGLKAGDGSKLVAWWKAEKPGRAIAVYDDFSWKGDRRAGSRGCPMKAAHDRGGGSSGNASLQISR